MIVKDYLDSTEIPPLLTFGFIYWESFFSPSGFCFSISVNTFNTCASWALQEAD